MLQLMQLSDAIAQLSKEVGDCDYNSNHDDSIVLFDSRDTKTRPHSRCSTLALTRVSNRRNSGTLSTIREESRNRYELEPGYYLHAAVMAGNISSISYLLINGSDPNTIQHGFTPLTLCLSLHKHLQTTLSVTKELVGHGANVNLMSPLHIACRKGLIPVVEFLLENGASTEMLESSTGLTVLQLALMLVANSSTDSHIDLYKTVCLAILNNSDVDVINCGLDGRSPLELAIHTQQPDVILALISKGGSNLSQQAIQQAFQLMESCSLSVQSDFQHIMSSLQTLSVKPVKPLETSSSTTNNQQGNDQSETNTALFADSKDNVKSKGHAKVVESSIPKTTMKQQAEFLLNYL